MLGARLQVLPAFGPPGSDAIVATPAVAIATTEYALNSFAPSPQPSLLGSPPPPPPPPPASTFAGSLGNSGGLVVAVLVGISAAGSSNISIMTGGRCGGTTS
eukprot:COSAG05_NODE_2035_length_3659_cov_3.394101_3_plen_102_part_00